MSQRWDYLHVSLRQRGRNDAAVHGGERTQEDSHPHLLHLLVPVCAEGEAEREQQSERAGAVLNALFSRQGLSGKYHWAPAVGQAEIPAGEMKVLDAASKQSILDPLLSWNTYSHEGADKINLAVVWYTGIVD